MTLAAAGCGGGEEAPPVPDERPRPAASGGDSGAAPSDPYAGSSTSAPGPDTTDTTAGPDTTGPDPSDGETPPSDGLSGWSAGPVAAEGDPAATQALQTASRVASHPQYDRFVLEFAGAVPGYSVEYVEGALHQCGSGRPLDPGAAVGLRIRLASAAAHDEAGRPTVEPRSLAPGLPVIRTARLTCDFEGSVEWLLGLTSRRPIRVLALESPARLVVDVRRP
jgi:hypothetical protein